MYLKVSNNFDILYDFWVKRYQKDMLRHLAYRKEKYKIRGWGNFNIKDELMTYLDDKENSNITIALLSMKPWLFIDNLFLICINSHELKDLK